MASGFAVTLGPTILGVLAPLTLGIFIASRSRAPSSRVLALMFFSQAAWSFMVFLEFMSPSVSAKLFFDNLQFVPSGFVAFFALAYSLRFRDTWFPGGRPVSSFLLHYPLVLFFFTATDRWHGLARHSIRLLGNPPFEQLEYSFKPALLALLIPFFLMAGIGIIGLFRFALRSKDEVRANALFASFGLAVPLVGSLTSIFGIPLFGIYDLNPIWLVLGDIFCAWGIFRYPLIGLLPAAQSSIVESLREPVFVIDGDGRLVDYNAAFLGIAPTMKKEDLGRPAVSFFPDWPPEGLAVVEGSCFSAEITLGEGDTALALAVEARPFAGLLGGRVVVVRDLSLVRRAEREMKLLGAQLEQRVSERSAELQQEVERRTRIETRLGELNAEMGKTQKEIMVTLSELVESRGSDTPQHVARVSEFARLLGKASGLSEEESELLADSSAMHDIGKIGVPDAILSKLAALTDAETIILRSHTIIGHEILKKSDKPLVQMAASIALEHHEHWDGSGYPAGLKGTDISLYGRIVCLCDVFDSLSVARIYKRGWELNEILDFVRSRSGTMFDPALVELLFRDLPKYLEVVSRYPDLKFSSYLTEEDAP